VAQGIFSRYHEKTEIKALITELEKLIDKELIDKVS